MLPAVAGDCFIIKIHRNEVHQMIVIDGGMGKQCIHKLKKEISEWNSNYGPVDLFILTHVDNDHIRGLLQLINDSFITKESIKLFWFNYGTKIENYFDSKSSDYLQVPDTSLETSYRQGKELQGILKSKGIEIIAPVLTGMYKVFDEFLRIDVISPDENDLRSFIKCKYYESENADTRTYSKINDYENSIAELNKRAFSESEVSITNASSIACLITYMEYKLLFLGDAKASVVEDGLRKLGATEINPLKIDYCKVSHHGSKFNTSNSMIAIIDCDKYLLSSNWTNGKPSKECLARIVSNSRKPISFLCNYEPNKGVFSKEEYEQYEITLMNIGDMEKIIYEANMD